MVELVVLVVLVVVVVYGCNGCASCIMEYGSTPYVGMGLQKNGFPIKCVQNNMLRTLL